MLNKKLVTLCHETTQEPHKKQLLVISGTHVHACITSFEFKTTGPCGGDAGHGGYSQLKLHNDASCCMSVEGSGDDEITLTFQGDAEMEAFETILSTIVDELRRARADGLGRINL